MARPFVTTSKQKMRTLLTITFPQGFCISKTIGQPTLRRGGKKTFKRYLKSEQTDRQTDGQADRHTDGQTGEHFDFRKHRPRGPML